MSENRKLREVFGPKRDEENCVMRNFVVRTSHQMSLGWGRGREGHQKEENAYKLLVGRPKEKTLLGRCRHVWKNNIKMDPLKNRMGGCRLDLFGAEYGPVVGFCEHSNEPSHFIK
jgi:hypothetical protein